MGASGVNPNLIFSGETLTGGGVLSTSGSVAIVNGTPLANVGIATDGYWVGLRDTAVGPAYIEHLLEPTLQSAEHLLNSYMSDGQLRSGDARGATLQKLVAAAELSKAPAGTGAPAQTPPAQP